MKKYYSNEINKNILEILSKKNEINNNIKSLKAKKKDSLIVLLLINFFIALFCFVSSIGMVTSAFIEIPKTMSIIIPIFLSLSGVNTAYGLIKIIKSNKEIKCDVEQLKYLDKTSYELEQLQNKPKIKIDNIKRLGDWKKKMVLMRDYAKYKKMFAREYQKGNLSNVLKSSYYTPSEMKCLYNKTEEDILKLETQKAITKKSKR